MQSKKRMNNAVLIYFFLLIILVCLNMYKGANIVDLIYFISLICAILKSLLIIREN